MRRNAQGQPRRVYRWYATRWEILRQLPNVAAHLNPGLTIAGLDELAGARSDTPAASAMQAANRKLFAGLRKQRSA
jgi:hypothetical protein